MLEKISVDPKVHFGKPCVAGTRVPVQDVLELIAEGFTFNQILQDYYPQLTRDDIEACVRYVMAVVAAEEIHLKEASR